MDTYSRKTTNVIHPNFLLDIERALNINVAHEKLMMRISMGSRNLLWPTAIGLFSVFPNKKGHNQPFTYITLFKPIAVFCGTDSILWNILPFSLNVRNILWH
jgi:hypothetical protein